jgi:outer membrane protein
MSISLSRLLIGFALIAGVSAVSAAEFKMGFVDTDRVLRQSSAAAAAQGKLEKEFQPREKILAKTAEDIQAASVAFDRDAPTLSESERVKRQRDLVARDQDFQRKRREFQDDLNARKNEELQKVLTKANAVIRDLAKKGNYDVILQDVVYVNPKHDMTPAVISGLDAAQ